MAERPQRIKDMFLIKEANEELEIRHHFPAPDSKVEEPVKSKAQ